MRFPKALVSPAMIAAAFLACASPATAQGRWYSVMEDENVTISVDTLTKKWHDDVWDVWTRWTFTTPQEGGLTSLTQRFVIDCGTKNLKSLQIVKYSSKGKVLYSGGPEDETIEKWKTPFPGSIGEGLVEGLCRQRRVLDGSWNLELKQWFAEYVERDSIRREYCRKSLDPVITATCRQWRNGPIVRKGQRAATEAERHRHSQVRDRLDSLFQLDPLRPVPKP